MATMERLPLENDQFGSKIKNDKNMRKMSVQGHYSCFVQKKKKKNDSKKPLIFKNRDDFKNWAK